MEQEAIQTTPPPNGSGPQTLLTGERALPLASVFRSRPYWSMRTPRWIMRYIRQRNAYLATDNYAFRINQVDEDFIQPKMVARGDTTQLPHDRLRVAHSHEEGTQLETSYALYDEDSKIVHLRPIQAVLKVHARVPTLFSNNFDQLEQQTDITTDYMYEMEENLFFNHPEYGVLNNAAPPYRITTDDPPTPDLLDDMLSRVWIQPDVFVMHPETLQAIRSQVTALGLSLDVVELFGERFSAWRGIPIFPSNKLLMTPKEGEKKEGAAYDLEDGVRGPCTTHVALMRIGEAEQGVVGLYAANNPGSARYPLISVDFMGVSQDAVASYLLSMYVAAAVLTPHALSVAQVTV